ncbi:MAG: glycine cleavage system protein H [Acidobacteria bacterium]|nr:glycine cleavage system protein H [Acidobacteriota bacterium]
MFPGVDGFHWTFGHVVFLGLFFAVALTIFTTVVRAVWRSVEDFRSRRATAICWDLEFAGMPEAERCCRHELAGRVAERTCPNSFDCRRCAEYEKFAALPASSPATSFGLDYPAGRLYHRGHTWVRPESDGTYTIGLDDLASHLVGKPDSVELPEPGAAIDANGTAWTLRKGRNEVRVRAPIDGTVVETGGADRGWYLRVRPEGEPNLRHLLQGPEVTAWLSKELERLQIQLGAPDAAPSLADGGILMDGLMDAMPQADWDNALASTFLE